MAWWDKDTHLKFKDAYNKMWWRLFLSTPEPTSEQTVEQAIQIMKTFERMARCEGGTIWTSRNSMFGDLNPGRDVFMSGQLMSPYEDCITSTRTDVAPGLLKQSWGHARLPRSRVIRFACWWAL